MTVKCFMTVNWISMLLSVGTLVVFTLFFTTVKLHIFKAYALPGFLLQAVPFCRCTYVNRDIPRTEKKFKICYTLSQGFQVTDSQPVNFWNYVHFLCYYVLRKLEHDTISWKLEFDMLDLKILIKLNDLHKKHLTKRYSFARETILEYALSKRDNSWICLLKI